MNRNFKRCACGGFCAFHLVLIILGFHLNHHLQFVLSVQKPAKASHLFSLENLWWDLEHFKAAHCSKIVQGTINAACSTTDIFEAGPDLIAHKGFSAWVPQLLSHELDEHTQTGSKLDSLECVWVASTVFAFAPATANFAHQLLRDIYDVALLHMTTGVIPRALLLPTGGCDPKEPYCRTPYLLALTRVFAREVIPSEDFFTRGPVCVQKLVVRQYRHWNIQWDEENGFKTAQYNSEFPRPDPVFIHMRKTIREHYNCTDVGDSNRSGGSGGEAYVLVVIRKQRRIVNSDELIAALVRRGLRVKTVDFANLSIAETLDVMDGANVMVSMHGAGMVNMIFMPQGAWVVEVGVAFDPSVDLTDKASLGRMSHFGMYSGLARSAGMRYMSYLPPLDINRFINFTVVNPRQRDSLINAEILSGQVAGLID